MNLLARPHLLLLLCWVPVVAALAFACVTLGAEKLALERRRGADFQARLDLEVERERLKSQLDWLASRPAIEEAVAHLGLPLVPPQRVATR